jgi:hypothetical protein
MIHIMKLIERRFAEKSRAMICGLSVLSLAVIAGGIGLVLIPLPSEGQSGKSLSEADLKKIDDVTQTAMNAALARDFATWAALFLDDAVINRPMSRRLKAERLSALGWRNFRRSRSSSSTMRRWKAERTWRTCWGRTP